MVYSAYEVNPDFDSRDPRRPEYSDYRILGDDGSLQQWVHNNSGTILQRPRSVALPVGKYRVVARASGYGMVTVPVLVVAGQTTVLHLQNSIAWPEPQAFNSTNAVRLPDGEVVGWKSAATTK